MKLVDKIVEEAERRFGNARYDGSDVVVADEWKAIINAKLLPVRVVLQRLEWSDQEGDHMYCPECGGVKWRGHKLDCSLEQAIALFEEN